MNGLFSYSLAGLAISTLAPEITEAVVPVWIWRAFVSILIIVVGYFLKKLLDDNKEINDKRDKKVEDLERRLADMTKLTAAHEVMFELWIENLADELQPETGRRKTDKLAFTIQRLLEEKKK